MRQETPPATIEQALPRLASRTKSKEAGPQLRQASAAAVKLLKLASLKVVLRRELTVADGIVSVSGDPAKKVSYPPRTVPRKK